jgi:hypothetical protein
MKHKKLRRLYREERLQVRRRGRRKRALGTRAPIVLPQGSNQFPLVEGRAADPVFAANLGRLRPASCSRRIPMICSSVNRLGFMSIPSQVMDSTHFWRRSRGSAQQMDSYHAHSGRSAPSYARI